MDQLAHDAPQLTLSDYLDALARRKWPMLATLCTLIAASAIVAYVLPPVYRSTATILIEEQEIPLDLVRTTISSFADQRIQVISQQVMTRANLMKIVKKYDLYPTQQRYETTEEILTRMRKDIRLDLVNADVIDRRSGMRGAATIAFTLSYDGETADRAQKVANELTTLYLNQNLELRQQKAAETSSFLAEETERLRKEIAGIETRLAAFKRRNAGRLPELAQVNFQMRERTDAEILEVDRQLASLDERRFYIGGQLAVVKPYTPIISASGERILDPAERLRTLRAQVAGLSGIYGADYPDLARAREQMAALEREEGSVADNGERAKQLEKLKGELAAARERYLPDHPDIARLSRVVDSLERANREAAPVKESERKPENPAYIQLKAQLEAIQADTDSLKKKRGALSERLAELDSRLMQTPQVEREYADMVRDRENSVVRYRELSAKLMEAKVAEELEKGKKSERFSLIDPPQLPEKPRSPNRPAILLIGLVVAMAGSLGYVAVAEARDTSVRNARDLGRIAALPLLAVIPRIESRVDDGARLRRRIWIVTGTIVAIVAALALVHFFLMPLEVLWYWMLRRLRIG
jgi:uncharacterized protein involved in exopolysaccharide biosynthesis